MLDTMTATKTVGAFCGALLIFLLGKWAAEGLYHTEPYGEEQAYVIDTGEGDTVEEEVVEVAFADVYAAADPTGGERLFRACQACHRIEDGANGTGPHLYNVVGRAVGSVEGFSYSGALSEAADVWTPENLNEFLENPRSYAPGTTMAYNGMRDIEDRASLISWLENVGG